MCEYFLKLKYGILCLGINSSSLIYGFNLEYIIKPAEDHKNSEFSYVDISDEIPKKIELEFKEPLSEIELLTKYKLFEKNPIACKSQKDNGEIEIFISYRGDVRPCCFIGVDLDRDLDNFHGKQLKKIFTYDCSLHTNKIESILEFFDSELKNKWNYTHEDGKCIKCSLTCGKSVELDSDRLYTQVIKYYV